MAHTGMGWFFKHSLVHDLPSVMQRHLMADPGWGERYKFFWYGLKVSKKKLAHILLSIIMLHFY